MRNRAAALLVGVLGTLTGCEPFTDPQMYTLYSGACILDRGAFACQSIDESEDQIAAAGLSPELSPPEGLDIARVAKGIDLAYILTTDGSLATWGRELSNDPSPPSGTFIDVSLGNDTACGIKSDGTLTCWGNEWEGMLSPPAGQFIRVVVGGVAACAQDSGLKWTCWGPVHANPEAYAAWSYSWDLPEVPVAELRGGHGTMCGTDEDGRVFCVGREDYGVAESPEGTGWHDVSMSERKACALDAENVAHCWGDGTNSWQWYSWDTQWLDYDVGLWLECGVKLDGDVDCYNCQVNDPSTCDWDQ